MTHPAEYQGALLTVVRPTEMFYAARDYKIIVNGVKAGSVSIRDRVDIPLPTGRYVIKAKIDWCSSQELVIDAVPGQRIVLDVRAAGLYHEKLFNQIFRPSHFLALSPIQA